MGSGRLPMLSSVGEKTLDLAELREAHLHCLPAIYKLGRSNPDAGIQSAAKSPNRTKISVTNLMEILTDTGLLVRER